MDTLSTEQRSERMRRVKSRDTKPELELRRLIWGLGYRYRKNCRSVPGNPDVAFLGRKQAIFLHGCFWHRHDCPLGNRLPRSRTEFWIEKFENNIRRDAIVAGELEAVGWRSLVIWECELSSPLLVASRVKGFLDA